MFVGRECDGIEVRLKGFDERGLAGDVLILEESVECGDDVGVDLNG